jgi:hypothetical protein
MPKPMPKRSKIKILNDLFQLLDGVGRVGLEPTT